MALLTTPSAAVPTSLVYITLGTLMDIWTIVSLIYYPAETTWGKFLTMGFLITGLALLTIGLLLGPIGRVARHAELPPADVTPAAVAIQESAAQHPPVVVPGNTVANPAIANQPLQAAPNAPVAPMAPPVQQK